MRAVVDEILRDATREEALEIVEALERVCQQVRRELNAPARPHCGVPAPELLPSLPPAPPVELN